MFEHLGFFISKFLIFTIGAYRKYTFIKVGEIKSVISKFSTWLKNYFTREPHPSEPNLHLGPCLHEPKPTSCLCKSKTEFTN